MATTTNLLGINGSIGDITIYYNKLLGKHIARTKGGMSKEAFDSSPSCAPVRAHVNRFSNASVYGANLRKAIGPVVQDVRDATLTSRLVRLFKTIVHTAEKEAQDLDKCLGPLHGTALNVHATAFALKLSDVQYSKTKGATVRALIQFNLSGISGYTSCVVRGLMRRIDVVNGSFEKGSTASVKIENIGTGDEREVVLRFNRMKGSGTMFIVLTVQFFETVNRKRSYSGDRRLYGGGIYVSPKEQ